VSLTLYKSASNGQTGVPECFELLMAISRALLAKQGIVMAQKRDCNVYEEGL
jgi:hypothetical protein